MCAQAPLGDTRAPLGDTMAPLALVMTTGIIVFPA